MNIPGTFMFRTFSTNSRSSKFISYFRVDFTKYTKGVSKNSGNFDYFAPISKANLSKE